MRNNDIPRGACQICGRSIGIKTGVIAHHGYTRPQHQGYQTSSCEGAKHLPYELSCDAIEGAIQRRLNYTEQCRLDVVNLHANPPAELVRFDTYGRRSVTAARPEGFDAQAALRQTSYAMRDNYALLFSNKIRQLHRQIEGTFKEVNYLRTRKDAWVAPSTLVEG